MVITKENKKFMNLLEMDLSAEDAQALKESLEAWKAQEFEKLQEQVE